MCENAHNLCAIAHNSHSKNNIYQCISTDYLYGTLFVYIILSLDSSQRHLNKLVRVAIPPYKRQTVSVLSHKNIGFYRFNII